MSRNCAVSTARSSPSRREQQAATDGTSRSTRRARSIDRRVEPARRPSSPVSTPTAASRRGQPYVHESVIGTTFTGRVLGETSVGPYPAVETEIAGRGFLTGFQQFVVDPEDVTAGGFLVR